jgi:glutathione S-transferase
MKIYLFPIAPNPAKVALYLAEKKAAGCEIDLEVATVDLLKGEQRSDEHVARNPFARLPVLELDDGSILLESLAIIEYLEELRPEAPMIGVNPVERAQVRALERIADQGLLFPIGIIVHTTNSPVGYPASPEVADRFQKMLAQPLRYIDSQLADGRSFVAGDSPTIADCTLAAALQFARFGKIEAGEEYEHITRWDRDYRERDVAQEVLVM